MRQVQTEEQLRRLPPAKSSASAAKSSHAVAKPAANADAAAASPYVFEQNDEEVTLTVKVPAATAPADVAVDFGRQTLAVSVRGHALQPKLADGRLPAAGLHGRILREVERPLILKVLAATRGNQLKAAALLGLNRNTLRKKIRELDIEVMRGPR